MATPKYLYVTWEKDTDGSHFPVSHESIDDFDEDTTVEVYQYVEDKVVRVNRTIE